MIKFGYKILKGKKGRNRWMYENCILDLEGGPSKLGTYNHYGTILANNVLLIAFEEFLTLW